MLYEVKFRGKISGALGVYENFVEYVSTDKIMTSDQFKLCLYEGKTKSGREYAHIDTRWEYRLVENEDMIGKIIVLTEDTWGVSYNPENGTLLVNSIYSQGKVGQILGMDDEFIWVKILPHYYVRFSTDVKYEVKP